MAYGRVVFPNAIHTKSDLVRWSIGDFIAAGRVRSIFTVDTLFVLLVEIALLAKLQPRSLYLEVQTYELGDH